MVNKELKLINDLGAGGGQDIFSLEMLGTSPGTYVDIGCREPENHNNSYLHYKLGWKGICLDIVDFESQFHKARPETKFYKKDCINCDFKAIFDENFSGNIVDYLSLDVEGNGDRLAVLKNVFNSNYEFKVITIEHDAYRGYDKTEKIPQREFLQSKGYVLVKTCEIIEDFWINPKFIDKQLYNKFITTFNRTDDKYYLVYDWYNKIGVDFTKYYNMIGFNI